jgi:hypothetical protein
VALNASNFIYYQVKPMSGKKYEKCIKIYEKIYEKNMKNI